MNLEDSGGAATRVADLVASRARIAAAADEQRRRLRRELHDGAQQRLVHALIVLKMARGTVEDESPAGKLVAEALTHVEQAGSELREIAHRLLPWSLTQGGLQVGLESLAGDLALPVDVRVSAPRLPPALETTAYLVVAEALTHAVEHAQASRVSLDVVLDRDTLVVEIRDDGIGGEPAPGTGLTGLFDRVEAAQGSVEVVGAPGEGRTVRVELPVRPGGDRDA